MDGYAVGYHLRVRKVNETLTLLSSLGTLVKKLKAFCTCFALVLH